MSTLVKDVLYIKTIEKAIGRKLDELDLECIEYGEPIFVQHKHGGWASYVVPLYHMPHDLMRKDIDLYAIYAAQFNPNIWERTREETVVTHSKIKIANSIKATYE